MISVVVPSYNEEENVADCAEALEKVLAGEEHEIIFVDDGSRDGTWEQIKSASERFSQVRGIRFSRNFGKEAAIRAGLEAAAGEAAIVMDCDLQHPPKTISEMLSEWRSGAKVVEGKKSYRGSEAKSYGLSAKLFNMIMSSAVGSDMSGASDFILLDRQALDAVVGFNESGSFFRALAHFVGFERRTVYYEVAVREKGRGKFTFLSLVKYALKNIASFTSAPLMVSFALGILTEIAAIIFIILKLFGINLQDITAGIIILTVLAGLIMICLGIAGYYLSRIYDEIKGRPRYIVSEKTGKDVEA